MGILSYAQNFEDVILWRVLGHIEHGCYVDVGAQHPRIDSISRAFYEKGWRGVHVEPVPAFAAALRADRPDETVLQVALAERPGFLELNVIADTGLSTAVDDYAARHAAERGYAIERITVPVLTLDDVLRSLHGKAVHWLKIDVEGFEEQVLRGWDAASLRPWVVVVEATVPNSPETDFAAWDPLLTKAAYRFVYFDGLNRFYVAAEHAELAAAFGVPPNVFDFAELAGLASWDLCRPVKQRLGAQVAEVEGARDTALADIARLRAEAATFRSEAESRERALLGSLAEHETAISALKAAHDAAIIAVQAVRDDARVMMSAAAEASGQQIAALSSELANARALLRNQEAELGANRSAAALAAQQLQQEREEAAKWWRMADELLAHNTALRASNSWRITAPLRLAMRAVHKARRLAGRIRPHRTPAHGDAPALADAAASIPPAVPGMAAPERHDAVQRLSPHAQQVYSDLQQAMEESRH